MSREYPCIYHKLDGSCEKYSTDGVTSYCVQGPCPHETPSNADRIRAMDDETLAEFLYRYFWGRLANPPNREERLLEWLQQTAEEGSDRDG